MPVRAEMQRSGERRERSAEAATAGRRRWRATRPVLVVAAVLALLALLAGCSSDDGDEADAVRAEDATSSTGSEGTTATSADPDGGGESAEGCPSTTTLGVVTETTYEGDVEVVPPGTEFPAAHFTLDLDGSGFGPVLSGVLSTDPGEDVSALTHSSPDQPTGDVRRVIVLLTGPAEGEEEFPLGVYDVTYEDGKVSPTEGMGLDALDAQDGSSSKQAANFTELEITSIGDGTICGELRRVDRSDETSQAPTYVVGSFVADYSEQP